METSARTRSLAMSLQPGTRLGLYEIVERSITFPFRHRQHVALVLATSC